MKKNKEIFDKSRVDAQFASAFEAVESRKESDKIFEKGFEGASTGKNTLQSVNELKEQAQENADLYKTYVDMTKPQIDAMHLDKDYMFFPKGDGQTVRANQIAALKYANMCKQAEQTEEQQIAGCNSLYEKLESGNPYKSGILLKNKKCDAYKVRQAVAQIYEGDEFIDRETDWIIKESPYRFNMTYTTAKKLQSALSSVGIESTVVNKTIETNIETIRVAGEKLVTNSKGLAESFNQASKQKLDHKWAWALIAMVCLPILFLGLCIGGNIMSDAIKQNAGAGMIALPWIVVALVGLSPIGLIYRVQANDAAGRKARCNAEYDYAKSLVAKIEEGVKFNPQAWRETFDRGVEADALMYDEATDKLLECVKYAQERIKTIRADLDEMIWLPSGLNMDLLPRIIEYMESGMATDYKTAAWQAEQAYKSDMANEERLSVLYDTKRQQEEHNRAQMKLEQQRLKEAQAATEAQRQAAEYARRQAEEAKCMADSARETERLQREQTDAAKKQAETTQELLRRTDDPYYIDRWKK